MHIVWVLESNLVEGILIFWEKAREGGREVSEVIEMEKVVLWMPRVEE